MKKIIQSKIFLIIISGIIFTSIGIYAANYLASDVSYTPDDENWEVSNVNDALDSLYDINGELTNIKGLGDATPSDIAEGKTAVVNGELITGSNKGREIYIPRYEGHIGGNATSQTNINFDVTNYNTLTIGSYTATGSYAYLNISSDKGALGTYGSSVNSPLIFDISDYNTINFTITTQAGQGTVNSIRIS